MARNIEIKFIVQDYNSFYQEAKKICNKIETLNQIDTYFDCKNGRLKLRETDGEIPEIISYDRPDQSLPKLSKYSRCSIQEPKRLVKMLSDTLGVRGVIRKQRTVFIVGQTRIHLDQVSGLGVFAELEVVLSPKQTEADGEIIARDLMKKLGIEETALINCSYIDLAQRENSRGQTCSVENVLFKDPEGVAIQ